MIRRMGHIKKLDTPADIALLDRQLDILFNAANYSTSAPTGGGGTSGGGNIWSTSTRPALPSYGTSGYNTDFHANEEYTPFGWQIHGGHWTTATRPTGIAIGSWGVNETIPAREWYFGPGADDWSQA
jgi:hypothetical protein